jgi:hypothetical protein
MQSSFISQRQMAKVRSRALHVHCRKLLEDAGQLINQSTIGAPELMLWTLRNKKQDLNQDEMYLLQEVVHMIQDKPSLVLSLLEPPGQEEKENEIVNTVTAIADPREAGLALLKFLNQRMDYLVGS